MQEVAFLRLMQIVDLARPLGCKLLENGAELIGHVPRIAPQAYLHTVFPPLCDDDLEQLEFDVGRAIPAPLRRLYHRTNGLDLFVGQLAVHGLRRTYVRSGAAIRQPFSVVTPNVIERPRRAQRDWVFFSTFCEDGSAGVIRADETVFRCLPPRIRAVEMWPSLDTFLINQAQRLVDQFGPTGDGLRPVSDTTDGA